MHFSNYHNKISYSIIYFFLNYLFYIHTTFTASLTTMLLDIQYYYCSLFKFECILDRHVYIAINASIFIYVCILHTGIGC